MCLSVSVSFFRMHVKALRRAHPVSLSFQISKKVSKILHEIPPERPKPAVVLRTHVVIVICFYRFILFSGAADGKYGQILP